MPEVVEVELYRRAIEAVVGERVTGVVVDDRLGDAEPDLRNVLPGLRVLGVRRHGKVLLVDTDGPVIGWHFGMTGRLVVNGEAPIDRLVYGPAGPDDGRWDRLVVHLSGAGAGGVAGGGAGSTVRFSDPRRFGWVRLDPDLTGLGPDVWSATVGDLRSALYGRRSPVKAVLLDQSRLAGLGNMLADELLFRAAIDPCRPADLFDDADIGTLHAMLEPMLKDMLQRGGSHAGDLSAAQRRPGGWCMMDGEPLSRRSIGGRTTWWCPRHQR